MRTRRGKPEVVHDQRFGRPVLIVRVATTAKREGIIRQLSLAEQS